MNDIITIAQSTFYRIARLKALYVILVICILDVAAMSAYKDLSMGMEQQLMLDVALAIALLVGLITAMSAAFEIPRELREKTAQFILSKPTGRSSFVWGKFFGIGLLCVFNIAVVTGGSVLVYFLAFGEAPWQLVHGGLLIASEALVLTAVGLLLSVFLTDTLAAIGVFAVFALGHTLFMLGRRGIPYLEHVLPNFHILDVKRAISYGVEIPSAYVGMGVAYGIAYALAVSALAILIFSRKDIS